MSKIFFTADLHLSHKRILEHCNRGFKNVDDMNEGLIENWNKVIQQDDQVYLLGDVAWGGRTKIVPLIYRLKGRIFLIRGNHDHEVTKQNCCERFEWIRDYSYLKVEDKDAMDGKHQGIVLFHYPILSWNFINYGSWALNGHCHGSIPFDKTKRRFDVGVDNNFMKPISYEEIKRIMSLVRYVPIDHHKEQEEND